MQASRTARGWALVSPNNKIKVDTICVDRESAEFLNEGELKRKGYKVRRVVVELAAQR
jgi:hypothetical protein